MSVSFRWPLCQRYHNALIGVSWHCYWYLLCNHAYCTMIYCRINFWSWKLKVDHFVWFKLSTRFVQAPFYYPNMSLWASYLHSWRDVKQSTDSHWNRPWTVSQSQYIQRQSEFLPIWGPKMAHKFDLLGPIFYTHTTVAPMTLWIQFRVNPVETFPENCWQKIQESPETQSDRRFWL